MVRRLALSLIWLAVNSAALAAADPPYGASDFARVRKFDAHVMRIPMNRHSLTSHAPTISSC